MMDDKLSFLRRQAEMEMRRVLDTSRPRKRHRGPSGDAELPFVPIDRFRYAVVKELEAGAKGFIVTCNFRREKSATREASQLLRRYMPDHLFPAPSEADSAAGPKQRQQDMGAELPDTASRDAASAPEEHGSPEPTGDASVARSDHPAAAGTSGPVGCGESIKAGGAAAGAVGGGGGALGTDNKEGGTKSDSDGEDESEGEGDPDDHHGADAVGAGAAVLAGDTTGGDVQPSALALAKVGCRGVVVMRLSAAAAAEVDPLGVVGRMLSDLADGTLQPPRHCQRIIPLDATALMTASGLSAAVSAAAAAYKLRQPAGAVEPFSYAVLYHSRATETPGATGAAAPGPPPAAGDAAACTAAYKTKGAEGNRVGAGEGEGGGSEPLLDRGRIIAQVAAAMAEAFGPAARVNLKQPQVGVLVESFPVAGRKFAGVALVPQHMMVLKGRMGIKPLAKNAPAQ